MNNIYRRQSIRLKGFNYSSPGAYFVTICTQNRECLFGEITKGKMKLNQLGLIVLDVWKGLPGRFSLAEIDQFVIMPNHFHGIVLIRDGGVGAQFIAPYSSNTPMARVRGQGAINRAPTLGSIIRTFKALTTRQIHLSGASMFQWQRNYYEHVIRNDQELNETRQYIQENPVKWDLDSENPNQKSPGGNPLHPISFQGSG